MKTIDPKTIDRKTAERMRRSFNHMNKLMLLLWRLGLGAWGNGTTLGVYVMVITHTGRKTGLKRRTPADYAIVDGDIYCAVGFGRKSHWYLNMKADPRVEVWLPDGWWAGVAEEVTDEEARIPLMREVMIGSGFVARLFGLNPHTMTDEELDEVTATYPLIRIRRTEALTGPGGPGDLAWIWPLATLILLPLVLCRRRCD